MQENAHFTSELQKRSLPNDGALGFRYLTRLIVLGDTFDFSALTSPFHGSSMDDAMLVRAVEDPSGMFATLPKSDVRSGRRRRSGRLGQASSFFSIASIRTASRARDFSIVVVMLLSFEKI
ncbi:hypothetical protein [Bradyrhizobium elkanii]|uniref:hypothetical protein n=1 Tax=Bradyrhizobium elkanii TaxID=29448 RepID=UPI00209CCF61|nr:hypothetical protein [Bradyrhizobium elkanii]MCP1926412.1 hypothetical protein [Bradyrhizobium elkanii]